MSLRSRLFSLILRWRFKREPVADEAEFVRVARHVMNDPRRIPRRTPRDIEVEEVDIPPREGVRGGVRGEWVRPTGADEERTLLFFHGGGYIGGSPRHYRKTTFYLARLLKARIFVVDYRLAPEHRFPAAVDDGLDAYRYVLEGAEARRVAFMGDSAGGGLLLATMLKARKENVTLPAAAVCFSPYTDLAITGASVTANERSCVMFFAETLRLAAPIYLGGADPKHPFASPLEGDFRGFPPLQIFASTTETLLDDSVRLAERAERAGVRVDLQLRKNLPHVWPVFPEYLPEARVALRLAADFIEGVWAEGESRAEASRGADAA